MRVLSTRFDGLKIIRGINHFDNRGYFREIFKKQIFKNKDFIFWCASKSKKNVIRGLHHQKRNQQTLYVSVLQGKIFDVAVDLRKDSKTFGEHHSKILSENNSTSLLIPKGFAHGFCGLQKENLILYGITNYRSKKSELGILWKDKVLKIKWPTKKPIISNKDKKNITFKKFNNLYL